MDLGLTDRAFVVTAASSGLGRAAAEQLVNDGARVVLVARRAEMLAEAVSRMGPDRAVALAADLTDANTCRDGVRSSFRRLRPAGRRTDQCWWSTGRNSAGHQRRGVAQRF
jgi:3-oxoacyl-[acyl-carrier protein] reductase